MSASALVHGAMTSWMLAQRLIAISAPKPPKPCHCHTQRTCQQGVCVAHAISLSVLSSQDYAVQLVRRGRDRIANASGVPQGNFRKRRPKAVFVLHVQRGRTTHEETVGPFKPPLSAAPRALPEGIPTVGRPSARRAM